VTDGAPCADGHWRCQHPFRRVFTVGGDSKGAVVIVVVGVDAHTATYTLVAADAVGCKLGELTVRATADGHIKALDWARSLFGSDVVYRIAMNQIRRTGPGKAYHRKRRDAGDSHTEALRRLERRIVRKVFRRLRIDHISEAAACENTASVPGPDQVNTR
jgi:hypothetical protein